MTGFSSAFGPGFALAAVVPPPDTQAPQWPAAPSITITGLTTTSYTATAPAATDNSGGVTYRWTRGGAVQAGVTGAIYPRTGATPGAVEALTVVAFDAAGNESSVLSVSVTLQPLPPPPPPPPPPAKFVRLLLSSAPGVPAANLSGLSGAFFNEPRRHLLTTPAVTFQGESTDALGVLEINVSASSVPVGGWGYLIEGTDDSSPAADSFGWHGPVQVVS